MGTERKRIIRIRKWLRVSDCLLAGICFLMGTFFCAGCFLTGLNYYLHSGEPVFRLDASIAVATGVGFAILFYRRQYQKAMRWFRNRKTREFLIKVQNQCLEVLFEPRETKKPYAFQTGFYDFFQMADWYCHCKGEFCLEEATVSIPKMTEGLLFDLDRWMKQKETRLLIDKNKDRLLAYLEGQKAGQKLLDKILKEKGEMDRGELIQQIQTTIT